MRLRRAWPVTLLVLVPLALASCSGGGSGGSPTGPGGGGRELDSPTLSNGETYTHRFFTAGTFPYHCTIHASMTGVSVVVDAGAPAADTSKAVSIVGTSAPPGYSPATVTIRPGGKVTWTNNDGSPHTVTSGS